MALIRKSSRLSRELPNTDYTNFINGKGVDLKTLDVVNNTKGFALPNEVNATNPSVTPSVSITPSETPSISVTPSVSVTPSESFSPTPSIS